MNKSIIHENGPSTEMILNYIFGDLNSSDAQEMEKFLDSNQDYADMVEGLMNHCIEESLTREEVQNKLKQTHKKNLEKANEIVSDYERSSAEPETPKEKGKIIPIGGYSNYLRIAIMLLIFAMPVAGYFMYFNFTSPDALVLSYLEEPFRNPNPPRSGIQAEEEWKVAAMHYRDGKYEDALTSFEDIIRLGESSGEAVFYAGLCNLYKSTPDHLGAINHFESVLEGVTLYNVQAQWFLSLAYFKAGKQDLAKEKLTEISNKRNHYKNEEALKLLRKLK